MGVGILKSLLALVVLVVFVGAGEEAAEPGAGGVGEAHRRHRAHGHHRTLEVDEGFFFKKFKRYAQPTIFNNKRYLVEVT